ncbi:hypothetical protein SEEH8453_08071, partial [Salmonella enterica subsp. enterica serovar Heidelberg str. N18453]
IPPSPPYSSREPVQKYGLFCLYISPKLRGDENHRPGFDTKNAGSVFEQSLLWPRRGEAQGWAE